MESETLVIQPQLTLDTDLMDTGSLHISHKPIKSCVQMKQKSKVMRQLMQLSYSQFEPPRGKTNNVVSEQVRHKPGCTSTENS